MAKGLGIAALVIVLLSFIVPVVGIYVSVLALLLAAVGALAGERVFAIATPVLAAVNIFMFSPSAWVTMTQNDWLMPALLVAVALPIIAIALNATGKFVLGGNGR